MKFTYLCQKSDLFIKQTESEEQYEFCIFTVQPVVSCFIGRIYMETNKVL